MTLFRLGAAKVATRIAGVAICAIAAGALATGSAEAKPKRQKAKLKQIERAAGKLRTQPKFPAAAKFPAGTMQIVVSIAKQRATVFVDGRPVTETPVSTGVPDHPTPTGVFAVIGKARYHHSNIYSGAPMPYMHRLTWSGIAMHEGVLPGRPASHGCIRMPGKFVGDLFATSKLGMRVVIARDPAAPVEFASDRLFVPRKAEDLPVADAGAPAVQALVERAALESGIPIEKTEPLPVRVAEAKTDVTGSTTLPTAPADIVRLPQNATPAIAKPIAGKKAGPVQVFVSRKDAKVYVRQDFLPLFDAPVTISEPEKPWGTHVFTALAIDGEKVRWTSLTVPSGYAAAEPPRDHKMWQKPAPKLSKKEIERREQRAFDLANAPSPAVALERFDLPKEAVARIEALLAPGSSLIVSDNGLSAHEVGTGTDFVVNTQ